MRIWLMGLGVLAGLLGAAGVALAAIGAHRSNNPIVTTAAYFLLFHAAGVAALCAVARPARDAGLLAAASLLGLGAILFSGDLALRALVQITLVRLAAPAGGILMILGWLTAAIALPISLGRRENSARET